MIQVHVSICKNLNISYITDYGFIYTDIYCETERVYRNQNCMLTDTFIRVVSLLISTNCDVS